jgi:hypothetical protein
LAVSARTDATANEQGAARLFPAQGPTEPIEAKLAQPSGIFVEPEDLEPGRRANGDLQSVHDRFEPNSGWDTALRDLVRPSSGRTPPYALCPMGR